MSQSGIIALEEVMLKKRLLIKQLRTYGQTDGEIKLYAGYISDLEFECNELENDIHKMKGE